MIKDKIIGVAILCYDTAEHLDKIISEMVGIIDKVRVFLPETSFGGVPISPDVINESADVCAKWSDKLDIQILSAVLPKKTKGEREMECDLRNRMMDILEMDGCDYSLVIDCDEIYPHDETERLLSFLVEIDNAASYIQYRDYYKFEDCQMTSVVENYVPFFAKSKMRYKWSSPMNVPIDLARRYDTGHSILFSDPLMRHYTYIRRDIRRKLSCWTSRGASTERDMAEVADFYNNFNGSDCGKFTVKTLGCDGVVLRTCEKMKPQEQTSQK